MKRTCWVVGLTAAVGVFPAWALDIEPASRQKAIAAAVTPSLSIPASAALGREIELPELQGGIGLNGRVTSASATCGSEGSDLCYDYKERRLVYRPSRNWMPEINGLTPEHISVRRDTVVFKYSFR